MTEPRKPDPITKATKADFAPTDAGTVTMPDGTVLRTHEEKQAYRESLRLQKVEKKHAAIRAECDLRGIKIVDELADTTGLTSELQMQCGCELAHTFKTSASRLSLLVINKPNCPHCRYERPMAQLTKIVEKHGGKMLTPYKDSTTKVKFQCKRGHKWSAMPNSIMSGGTWCPTCATTSVAGRAERRFAEMAAERGMTLIEYVDARAPMTIERDGELWHVRRTNFISDLAFSKAQDVYLYSDRKDIAFAHIGSLPKFLPEAVVDLISRSTRTVLKGKGVEAAKVYTDLMERPGPLNFVNVHRNPTWQEPGKYDWGTFPIMQNTLVPV